ncbi:hypothetical protein NQ117_06725 [Paenibacillus sp. SC116]|uniref:hypothetical protein n=1 Tax=Paenibacillus sp. SC116 TaxID=2968986 RepID=UPI00215AF8AB|nr:hypothetical protein [Paenibacillus sp. SC116]MCR8843372.1 hypothetical protein [Paenibacillus sp. SC116]
MKAIPQLFIEQMQNRLGEEWESFLQSYHISPYAGFYYIQEPSAMAPVELVEPNDTPVAPPSKRRGSLCCGTGTRRGATSPFYRELAPTGSR